MIHIWQMLVGNFACVALLVSAWMHASYHLHHRLTDVQQKMGTGLVLGLASITSMLMAVELEPGLYFDLRIALIEISALFGGPVALGLTVAIAAVFRLLIGGEGLAQGLASIGVCALLGLAVCRFSGRGKAVSPSLVVLFSGFVGLLSIAVLVFLPARTFRHILLEAGLPIASLNMIVAALAAIVITYFKRFTLERDILRTALVQAPDFHYVKTLDHRFIVTNLNVALYHGREKAADMIGLSDLEPKERAEELMAIERRILESGVPVIGMEEHVSHRGQEPRWFSTSKVPLRSRDGELIGLAGVTIDISERKRLEQALQASRDIVTQATAEMSDGLALFDKDGFLLFCNRQYGDFFPKSKSVRKEGAHILDILRATVRHGEREDMPPDTGEAAILAAAARLHEDTDESFRLTDGRWLNLRRRVGQNGSSLVVVSDITAAKEAELGLRQLAEQMKDLAETDALTGVANRRVFDARLATELKKAEAGGRPLALLLIDIDFFKAFNDTYGHLAGDDCLRKIGACLEATAWGEADLPARYGGEEFAIILPETGAEAAATRAETLRERIRSLAIANEKSAFGVVTASIGLAVSRKPVTPQALIAAADDALYRAKEAGRNRLVLASQPSGRQPHLHLA